MDLYTDGGCLTRNPSHIGGTWAWCLVDDEDESVQEDSGIVLAGHAGLPKITNNFSELYAVLRGMEVLPMGWDGTIYTDSEITFWRVRKGRKPPSMNGIPASYCEVLLKDKQRLGNYTVRLVAGHPTEDQLEVGFVDNRGHPFHGERVPVSKHNVHCDQLCQERSVNFFAVHQPG